MSIRVEKKWLVIGGIAVLVIVLGLLAWQINAGDDSSEASAQAQAHSDLDDQKMPGLSLQRCVDLWNEPRNTASRSEVTALVASYVSVTYSDLYGDKCLVTAANPELDLAAQFLEGSNYRENSYLSVSNGSASSLPVSVTQWNASTDSEGYLTLTQ